MKRSAARNGRALRRSLVLSEGSFRIFVTRPISAFFLISGLLILWVGVQPNASVKLLQEHCARKADYARLLWTLLVLAEWVDCVKEQGTV